jgi:hypothetical protein
MATLKPDDKPACAEYDPELWFPDAGKLRNASKSEADEFYINAVFAMDVCNECPLFANGTCLSYAMSDATSMDYGIYAATLPSERRKAIGLRPYSDRVQVWEERIREKADARGIVVPVIPQAERPKSFHTDMLDMSFLLNSKKDKMKAEASRDGDNPLTDLEKTA